jgi:hypothetical protein
VPAPEAEPGLLGEQADHATLAQAYRGGELRDGTGRRKIAKEQTAELEQTRVRRHAQAERLRGQSRYLLDDQLHHPAGHPALVVERGKLHCTQDELAQ